MSTDFVVLSDLLPGRALTDSGSKWRSSIQVRESVVDLGAKTVGAPFFEMEGATGIVATN